MIQDQHENVRTGIRNDDIQSVRNLLNLLHSLLVTLLIIRDELDDVHVGVLARELVQGSSSGRVSSASEDDGLGVSFDEGFDEVIADASACAGY